ncbi:hypothetical protein [Streptomyces sp. NPDC092903]|uniref:effector-associated constant component EACC1 n=1 Tax=Streptomyces sp. NPDC092903 TaxID=3366017 RepID=UPI003819C136
MTLKADSGRFAADDDRWLSQVRSLHQDLSRETELVELRPPAKDGTKGGALPEVVLVITPVIIPEVARIIIAWLQRDRSRAVRVGFRADEVVVSGDHVDNVTMQVALEHGLAASSRRESEFADSDSGGSGPGEGDPAGD